MVMAPGPLPEKVTDKIATKLRYESEMLLTGVVTPRFFSASNPDRTIMWGARVTLIKQRSKQAKSSIFGYTDNRSSKTFNDVNLSAHDNYGRVISQIPAMYNR